MNASQQRANRIKVFRDLIVNPDPRDTMAPPISYSLDDFEREVRKDQAHRMQRADVIWIFVVALALVWGFLSGLAFGRDSWLNPVTALFGMLGIGVITASLYLQRKERK